MTASFDYQFTASFDYFYAVGMALSGFLRLGSVAMLIFGGELKYLFC